MRASLLLPALLTLLALPGRAVADDAGEGLLFTARNLPAGWEILEDAPVPAKAREQIGTRLGVPLEDLRNQLLSINGFQAKWNVLRAQDAAGAERLESLLTTQRGADFILRRGRDLGEVAGTNLLVARVVRAALGVPRATRATFEVAFRLGLLTDGDDGRCNEVFNLFLALEKDPSAAEIPVRIAEAVKPFTFGTTLRLAAPREGWFASDLTFSPEPVLRERVGDVDVLTFRDPPTAQGIPYVDVRGKVTVEARFTPSGEPAVSGLRSATPWWPAEDGDLLDRARAITAGATTPRQRVLALLRHVSQEVAYDGPLGSRHGTRKVFEQRFGRCWDKSDLFVTFCRALGIPAREVAGWVPPLAGGHVWTEVHLEGEGWIPADPTTTWLGTSEDYVPLFLTSDGHMKILHLALPTVRRLD